MPQDTDEEKDTAGTYIDDNGYRRFSDSHRLVHRWVVKQSGQRLTVYHHVHHRDHNKLNNDISNLQVVTPEEHERIHGREFNNSYTSNYRYGRSSNTRTFDDYDISEYDMSLLGIFLMAIGVIIVFAGLTTSISESTCFITFIIGGIIAYVGYILWRS